MVLSLFGFSELAHASELYGARDVATALATMDAHVKVDEKTIMRIHLAATHAGRVNQTQSCLAILGLCGGVGFMCVGEWHIIN